MATTWLVVFDDFADWQTALACREIRRRAGHEVRAVGLTSAPITAASGLRILPAGGVSDVDPGDATLLLLPGGPLWEERAVPEVTEQVRRFHEAGIPIAAICTGTLVLARAGLLADVRHTSNGLSWLKSRVPEYEGDARYVNVLDVSDGGIITAHSAGYVDFAHEIIKQLELQDEPERRAWYRLHREGVLPPNA
jgi:putative intracellular protease/amidase